MHENPLFRNSPGRGSPPARAGATPTTKARPVGGAPRKVRLTGTVRGIRFLEVMARGGDKTNVKTYAVATGMVGINTSRQIDSFTAANRVYVQLEGIQVLAGSRKVTGGLFGSNRKVTASVDWASVEPHLLMHGITRATGTGDEAEMSTVITERDLRREDSGGIMDEGSYYSISFWADLGAAAAAQLLQRQQSIIIDIESTGLGASKRTMYLQAVKCDGRAIVKVACVGGIITTNRGLVKHTAAEIIRAYKATFQATAAERNTFGRTERRIHDQANQIFDLDVNGRPKHIAIQAEKITTKTPGASAMLKSLTNGELTMNQTRALTATSHRYSIWMSREMYSIAEINQLADTINTEKLFTFGPGDDVVANLVLEVDETPRLDDDVDMRAADDSQRGGTAGDAKSAGKDGGSEAAPRQKLRPCRTYYFYTPTDTAVARSVLAEQLGHVVKIALNPHAEGAVVDKLTEAVYDNIYVDEQADKYITILENAVNKELFISTLKAAATVMSKPGQIIELQTTAGRMVFLLITVPPSMSSSDGTTSAEVIRELRRTFGDMLEEATKEPGITDVKRLEIELVLSAYGFRPDRQQMADKEGLFTQRQRKAITLRDATGQSAASVLSKYCSACIEATDCGIGYDLSSPKLVNGCEWMQRAAHTRAIEVFQALTGKPKDQAESLLQIEGDADYRLALASKPAARTDIQISAHDPPEVAVLKNLVHSLQAQLRLAIGNGQANPAAASTMQSLGVKTGDGKASSGAAYGGSPAGDAGRGMRGGGRTGGPGRGRGERGGGGGPAPIARPAQGGQSAPSARRTISDMDSAQYLGHHGLGALSERSIKISVLADSKTAPDAGAAKAGSSDGLNADAKEFVATPQDPGDDAHMRAIAAGVYDSLDREDAEKLRRLENPAAARGNGDDLDERMDETAKASDDDASDESWERAGDTSPPAKPSGSPAKSSGSGKKGSPKKKPAAPTNIFEALR